MEDMTEFEKLLIKAAQDMPIELQEAAVWLLDNIEIVDELLKGSHMTEESRQNCFKQARAKQEYMLWTLLAYQKIQQEHAALPSG